MCYLLLFQFVLVRQMRTVYLVATKATQGILRIIGSHDRTVFFKSPIFATDVPEGNVLLIFDEVLPSKQGSATFTHEPFPVSFFLFSERVVCQDCLQF